MKAYVCRRYGTAEAIESAEIADPVLEPNEVLVRIAATTVSAGDWRLRTLDLPRGFGPIGRLIFGFSGPRQPILGSEFAGTVAAVGATVTRFKIGDEVFGFRDTAMGCHAEFVTMPEDGAIAPKPAALTMEKAAALSFGGTTALGFLTRAEVRAGDKVLINGAAGCVGSAIVQIAKHLGARVTAVTSTANLDLVRGIGADDAIDYRREDFTQRPATYDIIIDTVGNLTYAGCKHALAPGGRLALIAADLPAMLSAPLMAKLGGHRAIVGPTSGSAEDIRLLADLAASGAFDPVIDSTFAFVDIRDAHRRVESRRKRGSVVVTIPKSYLALMNTAALVIPGRAALLLRCREPGIHNHKFYR
ncbi:mycocerosic acid synthase [Variibacter gotjawalensis]|uniref:Mycocerosic acid synthase n=1 Tax=Variibacter gotjawalensis TaxID=1333996 RepID=A0A0S3PV93_9BRAD|nr:NAD(P)-dependent alcohol dehydrogenase [Variibacter gotjawalensis]NIK50176.1 NADPH:quinone reductase-like Zn-dependent oxidoreductase [Variibacter gotjawalensis]RZS46173.1 NADPH:quinone reductase-like Zn-dependent oxidoreductase [Variibacter gotjawalensis]BAT59848.1 mycocerosic acid synthase [Variibacter gotjawalensis]